MKKCLIRVDAEYCKGCGLCVVECSNKVLAMSQEFNSKGHHFAVIVVEACTGCRKCTDVCPEAAIEIEKESD